LEKSKDTLKKTGLLNFFRPSTQKEHIDHVEKEAEKTCINMEDLSCMAGREAHMKKVHVRENAKLRKRKEHANMKDWEICEGLQSPHGTKQKVRFCSLITSH
jgi:hypothetical protein